MRAASSRALGPLGLLALAALLVWLGTQVLDALTAPQAAGSSTLLVAVLLCTGLTALSVASYAAWPSRWNVVAHNHLAFSLVAYVVPIFGLGRLERLPAPVLTWYTEMILVGAACTVLGVVLGAAASTDRAAKALATRLGLGMRSAIDGIGRRLYVLAGGAVIAVVVAFIVMGFVPALAPDPLAAKFFRGPYAASYQSVAPLYRAGTTAIALLLPLVFAFAVRKRNPGWIGILIAATGVMLLGLLRQPAADGLLLGLGVAMVRHRRSTALYLAGLVGVYFIGAALYPILGALGVGGFAANSSRHSSFLAQVAGGAPDISDQIGFLTAWLREEQFTHGLTFFGGLVPGHFPWNPAVWSLHIVNPYAQVSNISSGGFRLPAPLWGYVSFGWGGVVAVSLVSGMITGYLTGIVRRLVPAENYVASVCWIVVYATALDASTFYRLSYLTVLEFVVLVALLIRGTHHAEPRRSSRRRVGSGPRPRLAPTS